MIYLAAALPLAPIAAHLAADLRRHSIDCCSSWHDANPTIADEAAMLQRDQRALAARCFQELHQATTVALLYGPPSGRVGSFLEAGYALGRGVPLLAAPTAPDVLLPSILLLPDARRFASVGDLWLHLLRTERGRAAG
jgi:hypothetical protein